MNGLMAAHCLAGSNAPARAHDLLPEDFQIWVAVRVG
jgi:hypothetical protein